MNNFNVQWAGAPTAQGWLRFTLLGESLNCGSLFQEIQVEGYTEETIGALVMLVGGKVLFEGDREIVLSIKSGYACVQLNDTYGVVWAASTERQVVEQVERSVRPKITRRTPRGSIFVLIRNMSGFALSSVGKVNAPLERENYTSEVLKQYDHIIECFRTNSPCGRLILLEGPPGTGKSYMIRGFASEVNATFVVVSASLIGHLSGPDVVPVLLNSGSAEENRGPIVLVLEDADVALVNRSHGDCSALGDVLSIGDGLLGELADLRILATTNAERVDLDPAIRRPGRMCAHVKIGALSAEIASNVYRRLMGNSAAKMPESSIAEIYRLARADGWKPDELKSYRAGTYL